jgi:chromosome segregation ATPase
MFDTALHRLQAAVDELRGRIAATEAERDHWRAQSTDENSYFNATVEELTKARERIAFLEEHCELWQEDLRDMRKQRNALKDENVNLMRQIALLQAEVCMLQLRRYMQESPVMDGTTSDQHLLKKLAILCHPDKWSAGQPATELAHEMMVEINRIRTAQA